MKWSKPTKIWVEKDSEFYNRSIKFWLEDNDIEIHSTHKERKSVVVEKFIRNIICKYNLQIYGFKIKKSLYG